MNLAETEKIINSLIDTFIACGNLSLDLRKKGLEPKDFYDSRTQTKIIIIWCFHFLTTFLAKINVENRL